MRNKKYIKQEYMSECEPLQKSVEVMQNLPAHCVATARNTLTKSVDIDNVMNRCIDRLEMIHIIEENTEKRMTNPRYRRSTAPQFPAAKDLSEARRIGHEVLLWLQHWNNPVLVKDMTVDHENYVHRDPRLVSYHSVTHNENRGVGPEMDVEGNPSDPDDYELRQDSYA